MKSITNAGHNNGRKIWFHRKWQNRRWFFNKRSDHKFIEIYKGSLMNFAFLVCSGYWIKHFVKHDVCIKDLVCVCRVRRRTFTKFPSELLSSFLSPSPFSLGNYSMAISLVWGMELDSEFLRKREKRCHTCGAFCKILHGESLRVEPCNHKPHMGCVSCNVRNLDFDYF